MRIATPRRWLQSPTLAGLSLLALLAATPAQAVIVNVSGVSNVAGNPVDVALDAGSYTATLLDGLNDGDGATLFTAWSFSNNPSRDGTWSTDYRIEISSGTVIGGIFTLSDSPEDAFAETDNADRLVFDFVVPTNETVGFRVGDNVGFDNAGGVSLDVQRVVGDDGATSVPEPATGGLLGAGLAGALLLRRRWRLRDSPATP